jgi:hypothetical protein
VCTLLVYFIQNISVSYVLNHVCNYIYEIVAMGLCYLCCVYNYVTNCV